MAAEDKVISAMDTISDADINASGANDFVGGYNINGNIKSNKRYSFANFANFILNKFNLSLGGSNQTVKSAIDTLNSKFTRVSVGNGDPFELSCVPRHIYLVIFQHPYFTDSNGLYTVTSYASRTTITDIKPASRIITSTSDNKAIFTPASDRGLWISVLDLGMDA